MVMALGACVVRRDPQRYLALYLIVIAFIGSVFLFAFMSETRIYLPLIPFIVIFALSFRTRAIHWRQNLDNCVHARSDGRIQRQVMRAFIASNGEPLCMGDRSRLVFCSGPH
jgi:hypothetical protein